MDYEKRNKEILEKLRALRDSWASTGNRAAKEIEEAIPELIESEDERIRKEIIDFATKANNGVISFLANNYNFNKWIEVLEKRAEQKTVEWSERDKEVFQIAIDTLVEAGQHDSAHWLKSLKERVQHQNMWISVDKEVYIKEPILAQKKDKTDPFEGYVVCCDHTLDPLVFERYIEIENISPQNRWKPTESQLSDLAAIVRQNQNNMLGTGLRSLYEDLTKLTE